MRNDALRNRVAVIEAAAHLLDTAASPAEVSMDAVATAAGVGKGTLFRAVGSRDGLLDAVFELRAGEYYAALQAGNDGGSPLERALRLMTAIVDMKAANPALFVALEGSTRSPYGSVGYNTAHELLSCILKEGGRGEDGNFLAHVVLGSTRSDLTAHLRQDSETQLRGIRTLLTALLEKAG